MRIVDQPESAALGAALLAATGSGAFASVAEACRASVIMGDTYEPTGASHIYDDAYAIYQGLYPGLREAFWSLTALDE